MISVDVDEGLVALDARRRNVEPARALEEVTADIECRLFDSVRWRDAVTGVRSKLYVDKVDA